MIFTIMPYKVTIKSCKNYESYFLNMKIIHYICTNFVRKGFKKRSFYAKKIRFIVHLPVCVSVCR